MIDINNISKQYTVSKLTESDVDAICELCQGNTIFYQYCTSEPTKEQILNDMHITPPKISLDRKYYVGFYKKDELIAVMDLIDGYPKDDIGFIGFFMVNVSFQHQGVGSGIIDEVSDYLKEIGKTSIQLAINKGNPQSTAFWKKNGFHILKEVERDDGIVLLAEKIL